METRNGLKNRLTVNEVAQRLSIGRQTVYTMLEQGIVPGIRVGNRWLITRYAYEAWECTCGTPSPAVLPPGLPADTELRS